MSDHKAMACFFGSLAGDIWAILMVFFLMRVGLYLRLCALVGHINPRKSKV